MLISIYLYIGFYLFEYNDNWIYGYIDLHTYICMSSTLTIPFLASIKDLEKSFLVSYRSFE